MYWNTAKLTEVVRINPRNVDFALDDSDEVTFLPMAGVEAETGRINISERRTWKTVKKGYTKFQENDVLVAKITPCMENGKACIARHLHGAAGAGSTEFHVFRPNTEIIEPEWLYLFLNQQCIRSAAKRQMGGAVGQQRVPASFYESLVLPLPDIEKQRELLECLIGQGVRITHIEEELRSVLKKLKQARASILKAAVEGRLVETEAELASKSDGNYITAKDQLRKHLASRRDKYSAKQRFRVRSSEYKEPVRPNMDGTLFRIPEGWEVATVDQLADGTERCLTDGPFGSNLKTSHYQESGPRVIRLQNIGDGIFRDERAHISVDHFNTLSKHSVTGGDIVIASLGEVLPRSCILPKEIGPAIVKADCIRFSPSNQAFNVSYINYALNSRPVRRLVASQIHGVGRPRIGLAGIRNICIPLPPYDEQCRIVAEIVRRFSVLDQVEAIVQTSLTRCGMLRQAILKRAFEERLMPAALRAISAGTKTVFNDEEDTSSTSVAIRVK